MDYFDVPHQKLPAQESIIFSCSSFSENHPRRRPSPKTRKGINTSIQRRPTTVAGLVVSGIKVSTLTIVLLVFLLLQPNLSTVLAFSPTTKSTLVPNYQRIQTKGTNPFASVLPTAFAARASQNNPPRQQYNGQRGQRSSHTVRLRGGSTDSTLASSSAVMSSSSSSAAVLDRDDHDAKQESTETIPNWRLITPQDMMDGGDPNRILSKRATWSNACYQDALQQYQCYTGKNIFGTNMNGDAATPSNNNDVDQYLHPSLSFALQELHNAYRLYGAYHVIGSFNGGKDACVILELLRAAHAAWAQEQQRNQPNAASNICRPRVIYWDKEGEFEQVTELVQELVQRYDLDMICFGKGISFPQGLSWLVDNNGNDSDKNNFQNSRHPMAFVLGTRSSDPNAKGQGIWEPSSSSFMPPFMRVNPILNWNYGHVWQFLRSFELPVCSLYEEGYTSLGSQHDTLRNPALMVKSSDVSASSAEQESDRYRAAWMLTDYSQERAGRISKKKKKEEPKQEEQSTTATTAVKESTSAAIPKEIRPTTNESTVPTSKDNSRTVPSSDISYGSDTVTQRTVGLLIIGDEILKGYIADANSQAAALAFGTEGVALQRIVVVSDDLEEIVQEIHRMQQQVDVIVTSGGVGPTHDDVTIKSVAAALDCDMVLNEEMKEFLQNMTALQNQNEEMGKETDNDANPPELTDAQVKMATLPSISKLRYLSPEKGPMDWPVLQCRNIFILPGIPEYFAPKIASVAAYLSCQLERCSGYKVVLSAEESTLVSYLNEVVERHPNVSFGSYPFVNHPSQKTVITVEGKLISGSRDETSLDYRRNSQILRRSQIETSKEAMDLYVQSALDDLIETLPSNCVVRVDVDDMLLF